MRIGIDLGGTWIKAVLIDDKGEIVHQIYHPTKDNEGESNWKTAVLETVNELKIQTKSPIVSIGLSAPGLPNELNQVIAYMPGRMQGLEGFDWSQHLGQQVFVLNDAHAATLAELHFGAARGFKNIIMLTLGTGVGGGIVIDGKLYQGLFQKAGHLGHISINANGDQDIVGMPGSIEDAIGNVSITKRSFGQYNSTYELILAYQKHDTFATWLWLDSLQKLAVSICSFINIFSPEAIILGGGIAQSEDDLLLPLQTFINLYEWKPNQIATPILLAQHGDMAGAIGAASFAMSKS